MKTLRNSNDSVAFHQRIGDAGDGRFLRAVEIRQVIADTVLAPMRAPDVGRETVERRVVLRVQRHTADGFAIRENTYEYSKFSPLHLQGLEPWTP